MKRAIVAVAGLLAAALTPLVMAAPAYASCLPPDGQYTIWKISNKDFRYYPTNLHSDWVQYTGRITYHEKSTLRVHAALSASAEANAGVIFAHASASANVNVGISYSKTQEWDYSAHVTHKAGYKKRLHAYHWSLYFTVARKQWVTSNCTYRTMSGWPQRVKHSPAKSDNTVWRVDVVKA